MFESPVNDKSKSDVSAIKGPNILFWLPIWSISIVSVVPVMTIFSSASELFATLLPNPTWSI